MKLCALKEHSHHLPHPHPPHHHLRWMSLPQRRPSARHRPRHRRCRPPPLCPVGRRIEQRPIKLTYS